MWCSKCGAENKNGALFCSECGNKFDEAPNEKPAKKKKKPFYIRWWFILIVIIVVLVIATNNRDIERLNWTKMELGDIIPEPPAKKGRVYTNYDDELWVTVYGVSDDRYNDYYNACVKKGFVVDSDKSSSSYEAYNAEGYYLRISHIGKELTIKVEAPMKLGNIVWPSGTAGNVLPAPKSTKGAFSYEYDDHFFVYIGDTSKSDYDTYVNECSENGFNVDYDKGDKHYYADNNEGWHLSLKYKGNNIISIEVEDRREDKDDIEKNISSTEEPKVPDEEVQTKTNDDGVIRAEIKTALDNYEKFFDEYIEVLEKFENNSSDVSIMLEYADFMSKYAKMTEEFEKLENEDLNTAESLYYIEVQARINQKLLKATA